MSLPVVLSRDALLSFGVGVAMVGSTPELVKLLASLSPADMVIRSVLASREGVDWLDGVFCIAIVSSAAVLFLLRKHIMT